MSEIESSLLLKTSIAAFMRWLENEWTRYDDNDELNVGLVPNVEYLRQYARLSEVTYPFGLMTIAQISIDANKAGFGKRHISLETGRKPEDGTAYISNLTPVQTGCLFRFVTDNLDHVMSLSSIFIDNNPGPSLVLQGNATGFKFECRANINPDLDIPPLDSGEDGKKYVIDTTIIINSYMGRVHNVPLIKNVDIHYRESHNQTSSLSMDVKNGTVIDLEKRTRSYLEMFDKTSPNFRDHESLEEAN